MARVRYIYMAQEQEVYGDWQLSWDGFFSNFQAAVDHQIEVLKFWVGEGSVAVVRQIGSNPKIWLVGDGLRIVQIPIRS